MLLSRKKKIPLTKPIAKTVLLFRESGFTDEIIAKAIGREVAQYKHTDDDAVLRHLAFSDCHSVSILGTVRCCRCRQRIDKIPCVSCRLDGVQPPFWEYREPIYERKDSTPAHVPTTYPMPLWNWRRTIARIR